MNIHSNPDIKTIILKQNKRNNLKKANYLSSAKRVIEIESRALQKLKKSINKEFISIVDFLSKTKGRVIISGVGKSGHVGKKLQPLSLLQALLQYLFTQQKQVTEILE